jgi:hypothetical protein
MPTVKHVVLFERLFELTKKGVLNWQETVQKNVFAVPFSGYSVEIRSDRDPDDQDIITLTIRDVEGTIVEAVTDAEAVADYMDTPNDRKKFFEKSEGLYEAARRAALGADKALDSILKELDEKDIPF